MVFKLLWELFTLLYKLVMFQQESFRLQKWDKYKWQDIELRAKTFILISYISRSHMIFFYLCFLICKVGIIIFSESLGWGKESRKIFPTFSIQIIPMTQDLMLPIFQKWRLWGMNSGWVERGMKSEKAAREGETEVRF